MRSPAPITGPRTYFNNENVGRKTKIAAPTLMESLKRNLKKFFVFSSMKLMDG
jgi:serine/threonine-protein kinase RIO1